MREPGDLVTVQSGNPVSGSRSTAGVIAKGPDGKTIVCPNGTRGVFVKSLYLDGDRVIGRVFTDDGLFIDLNVKFLRSLN